MAITNKELIPSQVAETSSTKEYEAVNCKTIIDKFTATNITSTTALLTVFLVPNGGSASDATRIIQNYAIAGGEAYTCPEIVGHSLDKGASIYVLCDTGSALVIRSSGREITGNTI